MFYEEAWVAAREGGGGGVGDRGTEARGIMKTFEKINGASK